VPQVREIGGRRVSESLGQNPELIPGLADLRGDDLPALPRDFFLEAGKPLLDLLPDSRALDEGPFGVDEGLLLPAPAVDPLVEEYLAPVRQPDRDGMPKSPECFLYY
jgi:hypothetical protein